MVVADKTGVELKGPPDQRSDVGDEVLRDASPPEENLRDVAVRAIEGIDADG
jgi:hypothetical protein